MKFPARSLYFPCGDELLGKGSFSSVYLVSTNANVSFAGAGEVWLTSDARLCASTCRALKLVSLDTKGHKAKVERELKAMGVLHHAAHDNVVAFYGSETYLKESKDELPVAISCFADTSFILVELEYVNGGSLFEHYWALGQLGEIDLRHCARDVLAGLCHLHALNIMHGDLKPENILLARDFSRSMTENIVNFKLCDYGESELFETQEPLQIALPRGSHAYIAPEVWGIDKATISRASDIWSLFVLLYRMSLHAKNQDEEWQKNHPFGHMMEYGLREVRTNRAFANMSLTETNFWYFFGPYCNNPEVEPSFDRFQEKGRCSLTSDALESFIELLKCMAKKDPAQRPQADSLRAHKFLSDGPEPNRSSASRLTPSGSRGKERRRSPRIEKKKKRRKPTT